MNIYTNRQGNFCAKESYTLTWITYIIYTLYTKRKSLASFTAL